MTLLYVNVLHVTVLYGSQAQEQEKKMLEKKGIMIDRAFHLCSTVVYLPYSLVFLYDCLTYDCLTCDSLTRNCLIYDCLTCDCLVRSSGAGAGEEDAGEEGHHDRPRLPSLLDCLICAIARHLVRWSYVGLSYM